MDSQAAARMGDEIAHGAGFLSMVAGAVVGAVVGAMVVGAVAATGGLAAVIFAGAIAGGGLAMGQLVKGISTIFNLPEPTTGALIRGSPNVFSNSRAAIRAGQDMAAACGGLTSHVPITWPSPLVAEGSKSVYINGFPAARLTSKMVCGAHIKSGSPNVFIGGETVALAFVWDFESWLHTGLEILGVGALLGGAGYAAVAGWAAFGSFAGITGGMMAGFEGLGRLGDSLGPGYRDLFQGIAGMGLLLASPKLAGLGKGQATEDGISVTEEPLSRMSPEFQAEYAEAKEAGWKKPDESTWWPPNNGGVGEPVKTELPVGTELDRFGNEQGRFLSEAGDSFESRALPRVPTEPANNYIVNKPLPVEQSEIAPWFDQPGGGTQYKLIPPDGWPTDRPFNVQTAKEEGYLGDN